MYLTNFAVPKRFTLPVNIVRHLKEHALPFEKSKYTIDIFDEKSSSFRLILFLTLDKNN